MSLESSQIADSFFSLKMKCACVSGLLKERQRESWCHSKSVEGFFDFQEGSMTIWQGLRGHGWIPLMLTVNKRLLLHTNSCLSSPLFASPLLIFLSAYQIFFSNVYCTARWLEDFLINVFLTLSKQQCTTGYNKLRLSAATGMPQWVMKQWFVGCL